MVAPIGAVGSIVPPAATSTINPSNISGTVVPASISQPSTVVNLGAQPDPAIFANPGMTAAQMYTTIQNMVAANIAYQGLGGPIPITDGTNTNSLIAALGDISKLSDKQIAALIILLTEEQQLNDTGIDVEA